MMQPSTHRAGRRRHRQALFVLCCCVVPSSSRAALSGARLREQRSARTPALLLAPHVGAAAVSRAGRASTELHTLIFFKNKNETHVRPTLSHDRPKPQLMPHLCRMRM